MDRNESIGIGVAVVGHAALLAVLGLRLAMQPANPPKPINPPMAVEIIDEAFSAPSGDASAGEPQPAAAQVPEPEPAPIEPEPAPPEPQLAPQPKPQPNPAPKPVVAPKPVPKPVYKPIIPKRPVAPIVAVKPTPKKPVTQPKRLPPKPAPVKPVARPSPKPVAKPTPKPSAKPSAVPKPSPVPKPGGGLGDLRERLKGNPDRTAGSGGGAPKPKPVGSGTVPGPAKPPSAEVAKRKNRASIYAEVRPFFQKYAPDGPDVEGLVTVIEVKVNPNGTLSGAPRLVEQRGKSDINRAQQQLHVSSAMKAIQLAAPFAMSEKDFEGVQIILLEFKLQ